MIKEFLRNSADIDQINKQAVKSPESLIITSEHLYKTQVDELIKEIVGSKEKYRGILLSGPSSSGKTTTSKLIRQGLLKESITSIVISLDDFFLNRDKTPKLSDGSFDYENIYALDLDYLNNFLDELFKKNKAKMPIFDFISGKRKVEYIDIEIDTGTIVILEGIHALNPLLISKKNSDEMFKIYICLNTNFYSDKKLAITAKDIRLMRRMLRDYSSRGHSISATISMWKNVLEGEEFYIKPFKGEADYIIDSTHLYEPLLYARYLSPLLERVENNDKCKGLLKMLSNCEKLSKENVPKQSLLWEFLI